MQNNLKFKYKHPHHARDSEVKIDSKEQYHNCPQSPPNTSVAPAGNKYPVQEVAFSSEAIAEEEEEEEESTFPSSKQKFHFNNK
ncbi:hypothetical protein T4E_9922 [Trichinella pseudospiralis]|uniref:Uncharacterized protein n=1 Tax=Trichinella pseudospiralis TaxID=6337 RepID=A0A0V0Y602_TRIPS|nr:hypothetical protein T4E_9922 [Trichinella pseudospiralis]